MINIFSKHAFSIYSFIKTIDNFVYFSNAIAQNRATLRRWRFYNGYRYKISWSKLISACALQVILYFAHIIVIKIIIFLSADTHFNDIYVRYEIHLSYFRR
ncbi:hypothetical protein QFZ73_000157 [Peribacillus sp. V2I11]|nr:hypothetical protein [Peribacillus sp. V2I11]